MSPSLIWSDKITNEHVAWVGYNHFISNKGECNNCSSKFSNRVLLPIFISTILLSVRKENLAHYFPYDVKLGLLAHSRSFLANQKARNAIVGAENLLMKFRLGNYISEPVESLNTGFFELQTFKFLLLAHINILPMTCKLLFYYLQPKSPLLNSLVIIREEGWHSGESACLPPMCLGFDYRTRRHVWVEFVVGSCLALRVFLQIFWFSSLHKN